MVHLGLDAPDVFSPAHDARTAGRSHGGRGRKIAEQSAPSCYGAHRRHARHPRWSPWQELSLGQPQRFGAP